MSVTIDEQIFLLTRTHVQIAQSKRDGDGFSLPGREKCWEKSEAYAE